jgi:hypothetical protein
MSGLLLEQVKQHRKGIKHETLTFSLAELVNMYEKEPKRLQSSRTFKGSSAGPDAKGARRKPRLNQLDGGIGA